MAYSAVLIPGAVGLPEEAGVEEIEGVLGRRSEQSDEVVASQDTLAAREQVTRQARESFQRLIGCDPLRLKGGHEVVLLMLGRSGEPARSRR